jgi:hypothetical protein
MNVTDSFCCQHHGSESPVLQQTASNPQPRTFISWILLSDWVMTSDSTINPYSPPKAELQTERNRGCNTHRYCDRTIQVRAGYLPSRLWILGGFTVTTDTGEIFKSAQASYNEDFRWSIDQNGHPVHCRLRTTRSLFSQFRMPYELTIGDDAKSLHTVVLTGAWCNLLVIPVGLLMLAGLALSLFWLT